MSDAVAGFLDQIPDENQYMASAGEMHGHKTESEAEGIHAANKDTRNKHLYGENNKAKFDFCLNSALGSWREEKLFTELSYRPSYLNFRFPFLVNLKPVEREPFKLNDKILPFPYQSIGWVRGEPSPYSSFLPSPMFPRKRITTEEENDADSSSKADSVQIAAVFILSLMTDRHFFLYSFVFGLYLLFSVCIFPVCMYVSTHQPRIIRHSHALPLPVFYYCLMDFPLLLISVPRREEIIRNHAFEIRSPAPLN
jgi:hypothetical protein